MALTGWDLLRSPIPQYSDNKLVLKELDKSVYGLEGLTDVAEWFLWERLAQCGLKYEFKVHTEYVGSELRKTRRKNYQSNEWEVIDVRWHLAHATGELIIDGISMPAVGGSDNKKIDAALKGAVTSAFKIGCKWHGMTMGLYKGGKINDEIIESEDSSNTETQPRSIVTPSRPAEPVSNVQVAQNTPAPTPVSSPVQDSSQGSKPDGDDNGKPAPSIVPSQGGLLDVLNAANLRTNSVEETQTKESVAQVVNIDDAKKRERLEALVWYGAQLPKTRWEPGKIAALSIGYEQRKKAGTLNADEAAMQEAERWLFKILMSEHKNQCTDQTRCFALHTVPVQAQFILGGKLMGPKEAKERMDAAAPKPPA